MLNKTINAAVAVLFFAVVALAVVGTSWSTVDELPQNVADQSNIEAIGVLVYTQFVFAFEVLSLVLLSALIGAIYISKGEVDE